ncbi:EP1-like glycoprotein 2 [Andrographis paniculata]|uniref:EP1-like glycoprotein 2 n=1 Tax=Andrographis paniculata TaxID=175694 RepID=UPI0021E946F9|nr:EP1-like glycoprotein 2 [Andrographis paniculata]
MAPLSLLLLFLTLQSANSQIPATKTFTFTNAGDLVYNVAEYAASYREVRAAGYTFSTFPFTLCFYNSTPGKYILAVRGGVRRDKEPNRWVWEANRRRPVGEKATLTLRRDGNLVLAEADGAVAWQTNTAAAGVDGIKLLGNGNLILHSQNGIPIWQSFDHPIDTLLAGMSLKLRSTRLISRKSATDAADGKYSLILEDNGVIVYLNNSGDLIRYADFSGYSGTAATFTTVKLNTTSSDLIFKYEGPPPGTSVGGIRRLKTLNYDAKYSFLRLSADGSVDAFTYTSGGWIQSFAYFGDYHDRKCALPASCGEFGLCENGTCVSCPSRKGLLPWTPNCSPPQLPNCGGAAGIRYYRIDRAEHFLTLQMSAERLKLRECREKCSRDCNCKGFVYQRAEMLCLTVPVLATLIRDSPEYSVYVKYSK